MSLQGIRRASYTLDSLPVAAAAFAVVTAALTIPSVAAANSQAVITAVATIPDQRELQGETITVTDGIGIDIFVVPPKAPDSAAAEVWANDEITYSIAPSLADSVTASESFVPVFAWVRTPTDSLTVSDADVKALANALSDSVTPSEAASLSVASPFADGVTSSEAAVLALANALADSVTASDGQQLRFAGIGVLNEATINSSPVT